MAQQRDEGTEDGTAEGRGDKVSKAEGREDEGTEDDTAEGRRLEVSASHPGLAPSRRSWQQRTLESPAEGPVIED